MEIIIILILSIIILLLCLICVMILKKAKLLSKSDIELISFIIDIYVEHGGDLNLYDQRKHDIIKQKLLNLKKKYFNINI